MGDRINAYVTVAMLALGAMGLVGCDSGEPVAAGEASGEATPLVPGMTQLAQAVRLDEDDTALVAAALGEWQERAGAARSGGPFRAHRAGMEFVAAVAPSLDNDQLADLVAFLGDFRNAHRKEAREAFIAKQGEIGAEHMEKMIARRIEHMDERADARVDWLAAVVGLSGEQRSAVRAAIEASEPERRAMLQAVRDGSVTREEAHAAFREHHDAMSRTLSGILTAEQSERLEILRRLRPREPRR